jgi:general secretion pathway protein B
MSFILDALKKSEIERQRQTVPGLMDSGPVQPRARFPLWAVALVALLGINLIVLMVVLTRGIGGAPAVPAPRAALSTSLTQNPAPAAVEHFSPLDTAPAAAPVYAPEIPAAGEPVPGGASVPGGATASVPAAADGIAGRGATATPAPTVHPSIAANGSAGARVPHRRDPVLTDGDYKADEEVLPSITEINLAGQQALPDLHLDVHVYATDPSDRFVYINMRKYHEGATLQEGPVLERIRRDGVILNYQGLRFVLPRQQ